MSRILFLSMYPLSQLDSAPKVRSFFLHRELNKIEKSDLIEGTRSSRTVKLLLWLLKGKFLHNKAVYVESSTTVGSLFELVFLLIMKVFGKRIFVFVRDAYPLFPKEFPAKTLKIRLLYLIWRVSTIIYKLVSNKLVFPSRGLAKMFGLPNTSFSLLPPGANTATGPTKFVKTNKIGYVGEISDNMGFTTMVDAVKLVSRIYPDVRLVVVAKEEVATSEKSDFIELKTADYYNLKNALQSCSVCLIPRKMKGYNMLTLPVKLFDYMSLGKSVITTKMPEVAKIVEKERIGIICEDRPEDLAKAVVYLFEHPKKLEEFQNNSLEAISKKHNWAVRAKELLSIINI